MATIERRKSKRGEITYRVKVRLKGHPAADETFPTRSAAKAWAAKTEADMGEGSYGTGAGRAVADIIGRYRAERLPELSDQQTSSRHLSFWEGEVGHLRIRDLTVATVAEALHRLARGKARGSLVRSSATVNRYKATLSAVLTWAQRCGWAPSNPARMIPARKEAQGRVRFLDPDERARLLDACKSSNSPALYPAVVLLLATGSRLMEVMTLSWADVDLDRAAITIRRSKNGDARRVPLVGDAVSVVRAWHERNDTVRVPTALVFPADRDPTKSADMRRAWATALKKAEVADFRRHDLRHTAASALAASGASLLTIGAVLGHRSPAATSRYAHLAENDLRAAVENPLLCSSCHRVRGACTLKRAVSGRRQIRSREFVMAQHFYFPLRRAP